MSGEKFLLMISNERVLQKFIKNMREANLDERELLSQCEVARVNVIPNEKYIEIFLEVPNPIDKKLLLKLALHIKKDINPEGEVAISPRPHYGDSISLFDDPEEQKSKYGKVSTKDTKVKFDNEAFKALLNQKMLYQKPNPPTPPTVISENRLPEAKNNVVKNNPLKNCEGKVTNC